MKTIEIKSLDLPGIEPYRSLRRPFEHHRQGIFVAEGEKVVRRLFDSGLVIVSVLLTPEWLDTTREKLESLSQQPVIYVASKGLLETIVGFHLHQGIMAVGRVPAPAGLSDLLARLKAPYLLVAVDGLTNAENLGVLVRNCAAFGAQALIVGETSSSPYLRRAVRNSMGAVFGLPVVHVDNLARTLTELNTSHSMRTIAAHPRSTKNALPLVNVRGSCCIVFGSEGEGISDHVLGACSEHVAIPMRDNVDSLNVASASAVFLYEVRRQRRGTER